ncbi:MAG: hypothetical protein GDA56_30640 [Hormoscilla sp. GM7CHS1pb]|nr:hypothetical protein [Hormoscilla sp. GM7CHS1pb]
MDSDNLRKKPNRNPPTSNRQLLIILGLFVGFIAIVLWLLWWAIGLLVNALVWYIPIEVEQQLGAAIVPVYEQQALGASQICKDSCRGDWHSCANYDISLQIDSPQASPCTPRGLPRTNCF